MKFPILSSDSLSIYKTLQNYEPVIIPGKGHTGKTPSYLVSYQILLGGAQ